MPSTPSSIERCELQPSEARVSAFHKTLQNFYTTCTDRLRPRVLHLPHDSTARVAVVVLSACSARISSTKNPLLAVRLHRMDN